ncbi:MAG: TAXI family TRAP transporter solute-binding subunit, partial [Clostridiales Family XIII bacterium]|nr:TAXI family TRAP transporter solute-binding subunit [Clostridiales Family XIII bacterium]
MSACGNSSETSSSSASQPDTSVSSEDSETEATVDLQNLSPDMLRVAGGASGGMYYTFATAWVQEIEKNTNIRFQVEATEGGASNVALVSQDANYIGLTSTPLVYEGENMTGWAKDSTVPYDGITALFPIYPSAFFCYALSDKGYGDIHDLEGKTVCLGPAGSSYDFQSNIYASIGVNIKPVALSWADAVNSLKDGTVDAVSFSGAHPFSTLVEVELTHDVTALRLSADDIKLLVEKDPTRPAVKISAGRYKCLTEDYETLCEYSFAIC